MATQPSDLITIDGTSYTDGLGYKLSEIIDIEQSRKLLESFCEAVGIGSAIIDMEGNILIGVRWQDICTGFHRVNETTCARCIESDTGLANELEAGNRFSLYKCKNGMTDAASPIIVEGHHVANAFVGQFLLGPPDKDFFRQQARDVGFDEEAYLEALEKVPIFEEEKVPTIMSFLTSFAETVAKMGLDEIRWKKAAKELRQKEEKLIEYQAHLESQVKERTAELEKIHQASLARAEAEVSLGNLATRLQAKRTVEEVSETILSEAITFLNVPVGAIYVLESDGYLRRRASHALPPGSEDMDTFALGSGSIGQVAQLRKASSFNPGIGSFPITYGFGQATARQIITHPLITNDILVGVIELCCVDELDDQQLQWLKNAMQLSATTLLFAQESEGREHKS